MNRITKKTYYSRKMGAGMPQHVSYTQVAISLLSLLSMDCHHPLFLGMN